jgi:hypothetical protein
MKHSVYHIISDKHDKFADNLQETKDIIDEWKKLGDNDTRVYKITTEEVEPDEIILNEEEIILDK